MIRKSLPSGHDPMGGRRFSEKIMLKQKVRSGMTIRRKVILLSWSGFDIRSTRPQLRKRMSNPKLH
jgi:hypothetical protein